MRCVAANNALQIIKLGRNSLHDEGAQHVANVLEQNGQPCARTQTLICGVLWAVGIVDIDLSDNGIGNAGVVGLAQALVGNTNLITLDLQRNQIGDEGAAAFARSLEVTNVLLCCCWPTAIGYVAEEPGTSIDKLPF